MATPNQVLVISDPNTVNALQNFLAYQNYMQNYEGAPSKPVNQYEGAPTDPRKQYIEEQATKRPRYEEPPVVPPYKSYTGIGDYLKTFTIRYDINGLETLLRYMKHDLPMVYYFVQRQYDNFLPFVRGHQISDIDKIFDDMYYDIHEITDNKFYLCSNMNDCKFHECCKRIHPRDIEKLTYSFSQLQSSTNRYIDRMTEYNTSCLIRQIELLRSAMWHIVSRKIVYNRSRTFL